MSNLTRRNFLKSITACAGGALITKGFSPFSPTLAFAQASCGSRRKVLVSIFLGGGPHGPSILVPTASQGYLDKHPTLQITNSLALDASHGLHPAMTNLHGLFTQGNVVVMNGVGYPNHSRSHEDSTAYFGRAIVGSAGEISGWGGRFAKNYCGPSELFSLFSFRGNTEEIRAAGITAPTASSLTGYGYSNDSQGTANNNFVRQVLQEGRMTSGVQNPHQQAMLEAWEASNAAIQTIASVNTAYPTAGAPTYPNGLGARMRDAAKLINSNLISPQQIFLSQGGYDTHGDQAPALTNLLTNLDQSIGAFWTDMVRLGRQNDVVVKVWGEFGRTNENNNRGTDHGTGGICILVGDNLNGGVASPAYTDADFTGRQPWVPVKLDFREVLEQIMIKHHNVDPTPILPQAFSRIGLNLFV